MLKPLRDYIIVKPNEPESLFGLEMTQIVSNKPLIGVVRAVGDGLNGRPMHVKVGDTVLYKQYSGWEIEDDGESLLLMSEINDILIIKRDE